jgi:hypothetical protein
MDSLEFQDATIGKHVLESLKRTAKAAWDAAQKHESTTFNLI